MPQTIYGLHCKFTGLFTTEELAKKARDMILADPDRYLTIDPVEVKGFEVRYVKFADGELDFEISTTT